MTDETLKVKSQGRNGEIEFEINLNGDKIEDVQVTKSSETPAIFNQVFDKLKNNILEAQSFEVDAISGASLMTKGMLDAGKLALEAKGINLPAKAKEHQKLDLDVDVAVIGSGMAGLMAASRALSLGKKVVVLEKNGYLGGATILNGSNVVGTGSKLSHKLFGQEAEKDSPARLVKDITRESRGTNDQMLSSLLANNIGKAVDFIAEFADLIYQKAETQTIEHSVDR